MITYLELLQLVKEGKQPKFIKVFDEPFVWDGVTYLDRYDNLLSDYLGDCTTEVLVNCDCVEVIEQ